MSYSITRNKSIRNTPTGLASGEYAANNPDSSSGQFYELEAAEVMDVIYDEEHPNFVNYEDIGKAKLRMLNSEFNKPDEDLLWARPIEPNLRGYPLKHEIVVAVRYMGMFFYTNRINYLSNVNHNENPWASLDVDFFNSKNKSNNYQQRAAGNTNSDELNKDPELGDVFVRDNKVKALKHNEGDIILEGRFANSIRLGSNQETHKPLIKIRAGQYKEADSGEYLQIIEEDINDDASSLYLAEDQKFELLPATREMSSHYFSVEEPPEEFKGKQIIANTDRIILNTKVNQIMTFSKDSTHMLSNKDFTWDIERDVITKVVRDRYHETDRDFTRLTKGNYKDFIRGYRRIYVNADEFHSVGSSFVVQVPQSFLVTQGGTPAGSDGSVSRDSGAEPPEVPSSPGFDSDEPHVLGWSLADFLKRMIQWIDTHTHPSPMGPTGPPPPTSPGGPLKGFMPGASNQQIDQQINSDNHYLQR